MQRPRFADRGPTPSQVICLVAELAPTRTRAADVGEIYKLPAQLTLRGRTQDEDTFTFNALSSLAHTLLSPIAFSILAKALIQPGIRMSKIRSQKANTRPRTRHLALATALVSISLSANAGLLANGGFETGDFSAWHTVGLASVVGSVGSRKFSQPTAITRPCSSRRPQTPEQRTRWWDYPQERSEA